MLRRNLLTGLLVMLPIAASLWVIFAIVRTVDAVFPDSWRPRIAGIPVPGLGLLTALALLLLIGALARNFLGQRLVAGIEYLLARIPFFGKTYGLFKQIVDVAFGKHGDAFRRVVLVRFPHGAAWSIGFVAGTHMEVASRIGPGMVAVFVPTTPNPTSGYYLYVREEETLALEMPIEQALKLVVTLGAAQTGSGLLKIPAEVGGSGAR